MGSRHRPQDDLAHLLVVHRSRTGQTARLCDAVVAGAVASGTAVVLRALRTGEAGYRDVLWADAVILGTPANLGYMSGAMKDFLEEIYYPCLDHTVGLPYALVVKGDTDTTGAVASVERVATGLQWRQVLPPLTVVGRPTDAHLDQAAELGATMAAGLGEAIF